MWNKTALIAIYDEDDDICTMLSYVLSDYGYATLRCSPDQSTHALIEQQQPDVVLLDISPMHCASGLCVLDKLQRDPSTAHIPIVVNTTNLPIMRQRVPFLHEYSFALVEKPFDMPHLLHVIADACGQAPLIEREA